MHVIVFHLCVLSLSPSLLAFLPTASAGPSIIPGSPVQAQEDSLLLQRNPEVPALPFAKLQRAPNSISDSIIIPAEVTKIYVDIGTFNQSDYLRVIKADPSTFLIGFEPNLKLFRQHERHDRLILLNAAVMDTPQEGWTEMSIPLSDPDCGTLVTTQPNRTLWHRNSRWVVERCGGLLGVEKALVPVVRLQTILDRLPWSSRPDLRIHILKSDAQGMDLPAILSAGSALLQSEKVLRIQVEVLDVSAERRNQGVGVYGKDAAVLEEVESELGRLGYRKEMCFNTGTRQAADGFPERELDCMFQNVARFEHESDFFLSCFGPLEVFAVHMLTQRTLQKYYEGLNYTANVASGLQAREQAMAKYFPHGVFPENAEMDYQIRHLQRYCCWENDELTPWNDEAFMYNLIQWACWDSSALPPRSSPERCCPQKYFRRVGHFPAKHHGGYF